MDRREQGVGFCWLLVSIFVCVKASQVGIGIPRDPGPGFLPFWAGVALGAFSISLMVIGTLKKMEGKVANLWKGMKWGKIILVLISLFLYALLLPRLGYLITTFGLITFLFGIIGGSRLWVQTVSALVTVLVTYIIFYKWLDVQLPRGIFGF